MGGTTPTESRLLTKQTQYERSSQLHICAPVSTTLLSPTEPAVLSSPPTRYTPAAELHQSSVRAQSLDANQFRPTPNQMALEIGSPIG